MPTTIMTQGSPFEIMAGTALTGTTFRTFTASLDTPAPSSTRAVLSLTNSAGVTQNLMLCCPYGQGANNAVITGVRFYGWRSVAATALTKKKTWIPVPLVGFSAVYGNFTGDVGGCITDGDFFMDTIALTANFGVANVNNVIQSNQADLPAFIVFDAYGFEYLEMDVDLGANATGFNALIGKL